MISITIPDWFAAIVAGAACITALFQVLDFFARRRVAKSQEELVEQMKAESRREALKASQEGKAG